ncbi:hypothetical protein BHE74_00016382 [Ensete ventricosum]|nr:hypothetical protein BHE74_00016382 [Ensete ventricosum]
MTIRIGDGQVHTSGRGSDDVDGNSPGVRQELAEGIGSLPGWRKGVRRKKTETRRKIIWGSRKACREFEGIGKLARNMLRNHRRKIMRLVVGDFGGCRNAGVRSLSLVVKFDCNL